MRIRTKATTGLLGATVILATAAGQSRPRLEFEAATIKPSQAGAQPHSNFPLHGEAYVPTGGLFAATNLSMAAYIYFAYNVDGNQSNSLVPQLPRWVMTDRYDIQARAAGNPTKPEMRSMMRALLADRLKLQIHTEVREVPVLGLVLTKAGRGPGLRPHPAAERCPSSTAPADQASSPQAYFAAVADGLPVLCNEVVGMPEHDPKHIRSGARDVTLEFIAEYLSAEGTFGRPIVDATGLKGTYDFAIEWAPQGTPPPGSDFKPDPLGTTFEEAIGDQLGLRLKPIQRNLGIMVVDRIDRPSEN